MHRARFLTYCVYMCICKYVAYSRQHMRMQLVVLESFVQPNSQLDNCIPFTYQNKDCDGSLQTDNTVCCSGCSSKLPLSNRQGAFTSWNTRPGPPWYNFGSIEQTGILYLVALNLDR